MQFCRRVIWATNLSGEYYFLAAMISCTLRKIDPNINLALRLSSLTIFSEFYWKRVLKKLIVCSLGGINFPKFFPKGEAGWGAG
jgi:hypothetical protein